MAKFTICFERKLSTARYENMTVSLNQEFDDEEVKPDQAFLTVREKVMDWIDTEMIKLGLDPLTREVKR